MTELEDRERQALALLAEGWSYQDIGTAMNTADHVVKNILVQARRKLKAKNGPHAVALALREKIIV